MGAVMGKVEHPSVHGGVHLVRTSEIVDMTALDRETVKFCWELWTGSKATRRGKVRFSDFAEKVIGVDAETCLPEKAAEAKVLFNLLDKDDDGFVEFSDVMLFLFTLEDHLTLEQALRRSFFLYDRDRSRKITKAEMVDALTDLGHIKPAPDPATPDDKDRAEDENEDKDENDDDNGDDVDDEAKGGEQPEGDKARKGGGGGGKKGSLFPDKVENLFSLMDFAHDGKISEDEFMRTVLHYRRLGHFLTISPLEDERQQLVRKIRKGLKRD